MLNRKVARANTTGRPLNILKILTESSRSERRFMLLTHQPSFFLYLTFSAFENSDHSKDNTLSLFAMTIPVRKLALNSKFVERFSENFRRDMQSRSKIC